MLSAWGGFKRKLYTALLGLVLEGAFFVMLGLVPPSAFTMAVGAVLWPA